MKAHEGPKGGSQMRFKARGVARAVAFGLLLGLAGAPRAVAAPVSLNESVRIAPGATVTVSGRGYGHGHGLSQYGARGAAQLGIDHDTILRQYYPGTVVSTLANSAMRVQLRADNDNDLRIVSNGTLTLTDGSGRTETLTGSATQWRVARNANDTGMAVFGLINGTWTVVSNYRTAPLTLASSAGTVRVVMPDGTQTEYRGSVRAVNNGAAPGLASVSVVPMEDYLRSVVPAEMPASWPTEALKSQAVAARTYAAQDRVANASKAWDSCDTTACQVYKGYRSYSVSGAATVNEHSLSDAAISATAGRILTYGGKPAFTQFSSSNGGWSAAGSVPYLVAAADPWDAVNNPVHAWSVTLTSAQLAAAFPAVGTPTAIVVTQRNGHGEWGGRVVSARIEGRKGSVTVTGDAFRTALGLRSNWWKISGSRADADFSADSRPDVLARVTTGQLRLYEGTGTGAFVGSFTQPGNGWQVMSVITSGGDFSGDGNPDVLAIERSTGYLWLYPSNGTGGFAPRTRVGTGWNVMRMLAVPGDLDGDGRSDLVAVDTAGVLWVYTGRGDGTVNARRQIGSGWHVINAIVGAGDMNGDGYADLLARDTVGDLRFYPGNGTGGVHNSTKIGAGWQSMTLLTVAGDWTGDGHPDILAGDASGKLYLYPLTNTTFAPRQVIGNGWQIFDVIS